jgi:hypothetical protein
MKYYRADFASGQVQYRSTKGREYASCAASVSGHRASWCGSGVDPHQRGAAEFARWGIAYEVSEAVSEVSAKEYREAKARR